MNVFSRRFMNGMDSAKRAMTQRIFDSQPWWLRLFASNLAWERARHAAELEAVQERADDLIRREQTRIDSLEAIAAAASAFRRADPSRPEYLDAAEELDMALAAYDD
jgi:hypothetical protein